MGGHCSTRIHIQASAVERPDLLISRPAPGVVSIALGTASGKSAITVQHDGSILVAATAVSGNPRRGSLATLSLTPDGGLANHATAEIGDAGIDYQDVADVTTTSDGRIIVVGDARAPGAGDRQNGGGPLAFMVARFLPDGRPDIGFAEKGWILTDVGKRHDQNIAHGVAVQPDGRIVAIGISSVPYQIVAAAYSFATVRWSSCGPFPWRRLPRA